VLSIIYLPNDVTEDEISRQGSYPTCAPVNPYTEFADIFNANYLPSRTAFLNGSVSLANSFLAFFLAASNSLRISGKIP
jgi:hypothetical protein